MGSQRITPTLGALARLAFPGITFEFLDIRAGAAFRIEEMAGSREYPGLVAGLALSLKRPMNGFVLIDESGASNALELFLANGDEWRSQGTLVTNRVDVRDTSDAVDDAADLVVAAATETVVMAANANRRAATIKNIGAAEVRIGKAGQVSASRGHPLAAGDAAEIRTVGAFSCYSTVGTTLTRFEEEDT